MFGTEVYLFSAEGGFVRFVRFKKFSVFETSELQTNDTSPSCTKGFFDRPIAIYCLSLNHLFIDDV
jgi:hypothetical protein